MYTKLSSRMFIVLICFTGLSLFAQDGVIQLTASQKDQLIKQFETANGTINEHILGFYIDSLETNAKKEQLVSPECWRWIKKHPQIRQGLFGASYPVRASVLKDVDRFRQALAEKADTYANLILACAYYTPHNSKEGYDGPSLTGDVDKICAYMQDKNLTLVEIVSSESTLLPQLSISINKKAKEELWAQVAFKTNTYPGPKSSSRLEFMTYLIKHYEQTISINPKSEELSLKKPDNYRWPLFPLDTACWPVLIPLGASAPINECDYIWDRFANGEGISRYAKYGRQYNKPDVKYKKSVWHPKSAPRILEDGGVCGRLSSMARRTNLALGIPSMHMGQPKHSAYAAFKYTKEDGYTINKGHSIASDNNSRAVWPLRDAQGWRTVQDNNKCHIEYHQGLVAALNSSLKSCIQSRICVNLTQAIEDLSTEKKIRFLENSLIQDPYNTEACYRLAELQINDLDAIHGLVNRIRSLSIQNSIESEESRNANDDLGDVSESVSTAEASISAWSLAVSSVIIEQVYTLGQFTPEQTKQALTNLKSEFAFQKSLNKSHHLETIQQIVNQYEIKIHGIEPTQKCVRHDTMALLELLSQNNRSSDLKKINKTLKSEIKHIDLVLNNLLDAKEKIRFLSTFQKAFPEQQIATRPKDKIKTNGFYEYLIKKQVAIYKENGEISKVNGLMKNYELAKTKLSPK